MSMKYDFTTILNREGTGAIAVSKIPFDNAEIKEGFSTPGFGFTSSASTNANV